jgi:hypothetical protein
MVFWDMTLCNLADRYGCFGEPCCHQQGKRSTPTLKMAAAGFFKMYIPIYQNIQHHVARDCDCNMSVVYLSLVYIKILSLVKSND